MREVKSGSRSEENIEVREFIERGIIEQGGFFNKSVTTTDELVVFLSGWFRRYISAEVVGKLMREIITIGRTDLTEYLVKPWGRGGRRTMVWILRGPPDGGRWSTQPLTPRQQKKFEGRQPSQQDVGVDNLLQELSKPWYH